MSVTISPLVAANNNFVRHSLTFFQNWQDKPKIDTIGCVVLPGVRTNTGQAGQKSRESAVLDFDFAAAAFDAGFYYGEAEAAC